MHTTLENSVNAMDGITVTSKLSQQAMDTMHALSNRRLGKIKRQRFKDGLSYQEMCLVLKADVELPGKVDSKTTDDSPTTDNIAGE